MEWRYAVYALPFVGLAGAYGIHRLGVRSSAFVSLILLIALFLPFPMIVSRAYFRSLAQPIAALFQVAVCLVPPLALVAASSLLCLAVVLLRRARTPEAALGRPKAVEGKGGWLPAAALGLLSVLLLAR